MFQLFVETGIQYIDLEEPLDFKDADANRPHRFTIVQGGRVVALAERVSDVGVLDASEDDLSDGEGNLAFTANDAIGMFARRWIPIPYHTTKPMWVRGFLEPRMNASGQVYSLVLACDTHSRPDNRNDNLGLLRDREIGYTFAVNPELESFWAHPEVRQAAQEAWGDWSRERSELWHPFDGEKTSAEDGVTTAMARLRALIRFLSKKLPKIKICMGSETETVDTHLVLDLGNCRTCGIVVETPDGQRPLFASLEMRSHELPCRKSDGPFESHLQFVRPVGRKRDDAQDDNRFHGISLIRLGDEAVEAGTLAGIGGAMTSMSSPKRYLWDDRPRPADWCFAPTALDETSAPIEGPLLRYLDPANPFREPQVTLLPNPSNPRYSRRCGLVFFLLEILEQAFAQINSVSHRMHMPVVGSESRRRIFRSLVLVHPSGMTPQERKEIEQGARRAIDIWFDSYRDPIAFRRGDSNKLPALPIQPTSRNRLPL